MLFAYVIFAFFTLTQSLEIVVSQTGVDTDGCGNATNPCNTLRYPLVHSISNTTTSITIRVLQGTYSGINNTQIKLGTNGLTAGHPVLEIIGEQGTVFDFQNISSGWTIDTYANNISISSVTFTRMLGRGLSVATATGQQLAVTYVFSNCDFYSNLFLLDEQGNSEGLDVTVSASTKVIVDNCRFSKNIGDINFAYGPLLLKSGNIIARNSYFSENEARSGPLTILNSDESLDSLTVDVSNCTFRNNSGLESAAVYSRKIRKTNSVTFSNLNIQDNKAILSIVTLSNGPQTFSNSIISNNNGYQGALRIDNDRPDKPLISIINCRIENNKAESVVGGLECENANLNLEGTIISGNLLGNTSNTDSQISCTNCGGCNSTNPLPPPGVNLGLAIGIPLPIVLIIVVIIIVRCRSQGYVEIK